MKSEKKRPIDMKAERSGLIENNKEKIYLTQRHREHREIETGTVLIMGAFGSGRNHLIL